MTDCRDGTGPSPPPAVLRFIPAGKLLAAAVVTVSVVAVLLHLPLVFGGQWQGDEWAQFYRLRADGVGWFFFRLIEWSPRPASETLLAGYYIAERAFHNALIEVFLGLLWISLAASMVAAARGSPRHAAKWPIVALLGAAFLLGHRLFSTFLWPMSAAAYVLALAGVAGFVIRGLFAGEPETPGQRAFCFSMLMLAATAAECGTFFVFALGVLLLLTHAMSGDLRRPALSHYWYLAPLAVAIGVILLGLRFRASQPPATAGGPYLLDFGTSLLASLHDLPFRLFLPGDVTRDMPPPQAVAVHLLTFIGSALLFSAAPLPGRTLRFRAMMTAGLVGAIGLVSLSAYYAYGIPGAEAHQTFQDCLAILAAVTMASILPASRWSPAVQQPLGFTALLVAVIIGLTARLPDLLRDYSVIAPIRQAIAETWKSGTDAGSSMTFLNPPSGHLLLAVPMEPGSFSLATGARWDTIAMLRFFGKSRVAVVVWGTDHH